MKIIITGMPYFANKIYNQLKSYDKDNNYIYLNTFYSKIDKLKYLFHILNSDILYIIGGSVSSSGTIDLALKLNKKIVLHWAGTDVLEASKVVNSNLFDNRYINNITHLCETTWIQEELDSIGVKATIAPMMIYNKQKYQNLEMPNEFKILSYIGKDRPEFYGIEILIKLAYDFPDIEFRVAGIESYHDVPSNMKLLGWVDMDKEYQECMVYIITPEHDGLAFSVLEALSYGRVVFYNYQFDYVNYFKDYEDLKKQMRVVIKDFHNNRLTINNDAIEFVNREFSKEKVLGNLIKIFNN